MQKYDKKDLKTGAIYLRFGQMLRYTGTYGENLYRFEIVNIIDKNYVCNDEYLLLSEEQLIFDEATNADSN